MLAQLLQPATRATTPQTPVPVPVVPAGLALWWGASLAMRSRASGLEGHGVVWRADMERHVVSRDGEKIEDEMGPRKIEIWIRVDMLDMLNTLFLGC